MRSIHLIWVLLSIGLSQTVKAHDISLLSGFYRKEEVQNSIGRSEISLGARYALRPAADQQWFVRAEIASVSYSGTNAPDGATNFRLGGGKLFFIKKWANDIRAYLAWDANFISARNVDNVTTETETAGLLYGGHSGFRFDLTKAFYFETDFQLFESALTQTVTVRNRGATPPSEVETKKTEIYMQTFTGIEDLRFGLGYIF